MSKNFTQVFPYAKACFELLENDRNKLSQALNLLKELEVAIKTNDDLKHFLNEPLVKAQVKIELLTKLAPGLAQFDLLNKLFLLLAEKNKFFLIVELADSLEQLIDQRLNISEIEIITASELEEDKLQKIKASLEKALGQTIRLNTTIDQSLIAGIVVQTEEYVLDNSLKGRLQKMRQTLMSNN